MKNIETAHDKSHSPRTETKKKVPEEVPEPCALDPVGEPQLTERPGESEGGTVLAELSRNLPYRTQACALSSVLTPFFYKG